MNCELCQKELESYCGGKLPGNIRIQVEAHLEVCAKCTESYQSIVLTNRVISEEKELKPNPFLSTRIMAEIDSRESVLSENSSVYTRIIRPTFITASIAAAIFAGVIIGNLGNRQSYIPAEFELMDDMKIESDLMLVNE